MKLAPKLLPTLLVNLLFVGLAQAQSDTAPAAPTWMGVDSFADAAYLRSSPAADSDAARLVFSAGPQGSADALGSFRMLSRQGAAPDGNELSSDNVSFEAAASPVPELHAYALILAGLGVVGFMARRRSGQ